MKLREFITYSPVKVFETFVFIISAAIGAQGGGRILQNWNDVFEFSGKFTILHNT